MENKSLIEQLLSYGYEEKLFQDVTNKSFFIIPEDIHHIYQVYNWAILRLNMNENVSELTVTYEFIKPDTIVYVPKVVIFFQNIQNEIKPKKDYISKKGQSLEEIFANQDYFTNIYNVSYLDKKSLLNCKSLLTRDNKTFYIIFKDYSAYIIQNDKTDATTLISEELINAKDWIFVNQETNIKPIVKTKNLTIKEILNTPGYQEALIEFIKTKDVENFPFKVKRPHWGPHTSIIIGNEHNFHILNDVIYTTSDILSISNYNDFEFIDY